MGFFTTKPYVWLITLLLLGSSLHLTFTFIFMFILHEDTDAINTINNFFGSLCTQKNGTNNKKVILDWTNGALSHNFTSLWYGDQDYCKHKVCTVTYNRAQLSCSDAVLFSGNKIRWNDMPRMRKWKQRFVYVQHESPQHTHVVLKNAKDYFNWTMTYRLNSDILFPYSIFVNKTDEEKRKSAVLHMIIRNLA